MFSHAPLRRVDPLSGARARVDDNQVVLGAILDANEADPNRSTGWCDHDAGVVALASVKVEKVEEHVPDVVVDRGNLSPGQKAARDEKDREALEIVARLHGVGVVGEQLLEDWFRKHKGGMFRECSGLQMQD